MAEISEKLHHFFDKRLKKFNARTCRLATSSNLNSLHLDCRTVDKHKLPQDEHTSKCSQVAVRNVQKNRSSPQTLGVLIF